MRCPNCGTENDPSAHFCRNCGRALAAASEPTEPVSPASQEPTQPVTPMSQEPTRPLVPGAPPPPPGPPPPTTGPPAPPPAGGRGPMKMSTTALAAVVGVAVVLVGVLVWALAFRDGDADTVSAAPSPNSTVGPNAVSASPSVAVSPTGATGTTGTTGTTGSTGSTGTTGTPTFSIEMCGDIDDQLNCIDGFPYADGWTIPVDAPTFLTIATVSGLQPGDVVRIEYFDAATDENAGTIEFDPAPAEVLDSESWILYTNPSVLGTGQTWTTGSTFRMVFYHNDAEVTGFSGPLEYTFA